MNARRLVIVALVAICAVGLSAPFQADEGDKRFRFGLLYSVPTDELDDPTDPAELDPSEGYHATFEFQVTDLIGLEPTLAGAFYERLFAGTPPAAALRAAKQALMQESSGARGVTLGGPPADEPRWAHPAYWAPFVLIGQRDRPRSVRS